MSLIGNLEDLSLADILQIISLSHKSGVLTIHRGGEEGSIYLRQGKVILTSSARNRRSLGNILLERGLADPGQINAAVQDQRKGGMKELLGSILIRMGFLKEEKLEGLVQEQIQESIFYFLTWREGTFKFDLRPVDERLEVGMEPHLLISRSGIDTQWLVLEGTRLLDENRRRDFGEGELPGEWPGEGPPAPEKASLCIVDDDDYFRGLFRDAAASRGLSVTEFGGVAEALSYFRAPAAKKDFFVLDVVMPTDDGRGFLGGLDLARELIAEHPGVRLKVITAYPDDSVREQLQVMGAGSLLIKPELPGGEGAAGAMGPFVDEILEALEVPVRPCTPRIAAEASPEPPTPAGGERPGGGEVPAEEIATARVKLEAALPEEPSLGQTALDLVREVESAQNASEIGLTMLRLASEVMERAILFKANLAEAISLGGFGFEAMVIKNRDGLRNLSIGLTDSPLLLRAARDHVTLGSPRESFTENDLLGMVLGSPVPPSWVIIPVRGIAGSLLILYGDGGSKTGPLRGQGIVAAFMALAGLIMNRLFLAKQAAGERQGS